MSDEATFRIYKVWVPFMRTPEIAWAEVKQTAKQLRIVAASDRMAWGHATVLEGTDHARFEDEAWARYIDDLRVEIARNELLLAQAEAARKAAQA
jgi:hypothetical protein